MLNNKKPKDPLVSTLDLSNLDNDPNTVNKRKVAQF